MHILPFKQLMKERRLALKLSQKDISNLTNITPTLISRYENGLSKPRIETAKRIADVLKIDMNTLVQSLDQDEIALIKIPFYMDDYSDYQDNFFHIASNLFENINYEELLAYRMQGDSMSPVFNGGDILIINKSDKKVGIGKEKIFLISYGSGFSSAKYLSHNEFAKEYIIHAENKLYSPMYLPTDDTDIIGRVIWYCRAI